MKIKIYSNYKVSNKWLGIIDYKLLMILVIYFIIILLLIKYLNFDFEVKIYIISALIIPIIVIFYMSLQNENGFLDIYMIFKFIINKKIYIKMQYYRKDNKYVKICPKKNYILKI